MFGHYNNLLRTFLVHRGWTSSLSLKCKVQMFFKPVGFPRLLSSILFKINCAPDIQNSLENCANLITDHPTSYHSYPGSYRIQLSKHFCTICRTISIKANGFRWWIRDSVHSHLFHCRKIASRAWLWPSPAIAFLAHSHTRIFGCVSTFPTNESRD